MAEFIRGLFRKRPKKSLEEQMAELLDPSIKEEIEKASKEADEIVEAYGLEERPYKPLGIDNYVYKPETWDTRVILNVPEEIFPKLLAQKGISYIYEKGYQGEGPGDVKLWFVTDNKLRVATEAFDEGSFAKNIVWPSYQAQNVELAQSIGDRKTSPKEMERLSREMGFEVYDHITMGWVNRIRLLPPEEAEKYKRLFVKFRLGNQEE